MKAINERKKETKKQDENDNKQQNIGQHIYIYIDI